MLAKTVTTENLSEINFRYRGVDVDYHTSYHCDDGCNNGDYCRCGTIEDAKVTSVKLDVIAKVIYDNFFASFTHHSKDKDVVIYCIERVLRYYGYEDSSKYEVHVSWGYYGEEIEGVTFDGVTIPFQIAINDLLVRNTEEKIMAVLKMEYGKILPSLKDREWSIKKIDRDRLVFGNEEYHMKVLQKDLSKYSDWSLPCGVAVKSRKKYRLIDGYHRCTANKDSEILMLVGE